MMAGQLDIITVKLLRGLFLKKRFNLLFISDAFLKITICLRNSSLDSYKIILCGEDVINVRW